MEAEYVFLNRILGRAEAATSSGGSPSGCSRLQQADGSWPLYAGGPGNLSTTIEAYFALKLAGPRRRRAGARAARATSSSARAGSRARASSRASGSSLLRPVPGARRARDAGRAGAPPAVVPDQHLRDVELGARHGRAADAPRWRTDPRCRIAPEARRRRALAAARRGPRTSRFARSPELVTLAELLPRARPRAQASLGRSPWKPLRRRAVARAIEWILRHQDTNGQWGGIQPAMVNSMLALHAVGFAPDHPAIVSGVQGVDDFLVECEGTLMYQPCVSPNWDTALAAKALLDAGMDPAHPALGARRRSGSSRTRSSGPATGRVYNPDLEPGGWAFEFANDWYPDVDDSAVILMVLQRAAGRARRRPGGARSPTASTGRSACRAATAATAPSTSNNTSDFLNRIPFADMEAMIDPPTEDLTGRLLAAHGRARLRHATSAARGARSSSCGGRSAPTAAGGDAGASTSSTARGAALAGLAAIGEDMRAPYVRRAVDWLDGAPERRRRLGRDGRVLRRRDRSPGGARARPRRPRGRSSASSPRTARAAAPSSAASTGSCGTQGPDGTWEERLFTGTGLPAPLLPPLPPLPALLPADGARPVPRARRRSAGGGEGRAMSVGIERLAAYVPSYALPLARPRGGARRPAREADRTGSACTRWRSRRPARTSSRSPRARARAASVRAGVDPGEIGMLLRRHRDGVDHAKPVASSSTSSSASAAHCRVYELKHACYAGTAALMTAADWVRAGAAGAATRARDRGRHRALRAPLGRRADAGRGRRRDAGRATSRASSSLGAESGIYAANVYDFWRPFGRREALVDGKYSVECYLDALGGRVRRSTARSSGPRSAPTRRSTDRLARLLYHTPFPKMAIEGAPPPDRARLARGARPLGGGRADGSTTRSPTSYPRARGAGLEAVAHIGNTYTASLYLCLAAHPRARGARARRAAPRPLLVRERLLRRVLHRHGADRRRGGGRRGVCASCSAPGPMIDVARVRAAHDARRDRRRAARRASPASSSSTACATTAASTAGCARAGRMSTGVARTPAPAGAVDPAASRRPTRTACASRAATTRTSRSARGSCRARLRQRPRRGLRLRARRRRHRRRGPGRGAARAARRVGGASSLACARDPAARARSRSSSRSGTRSPRHALPVAPLRDLLHAFRRDAAASTRRFATFDDVLEYCRCSANPVGRTVLALFGYRDAERQARSRRRLHGAPADELLAGRRRRPRRAAASTFPRRTSTASPGAATRSRRGARRPASARSSPSRSSATRELFAPRPARSPTW